MSYCRFGWGGSDVYVFNSGSALECCGCILQEREWVEESDRPLFGGYLKPVGEIVQNTFSGPSANQEMIDHLLFHRAKGHTVPEDALERLRDPQDAIENQEIWAKYKKEKNGNR